MNYIFFLEQENGDFYIAYGYYGADELLNSNGDASYIRWVYRLNKIEVSESDITLTETVDYDPFDSAISSAILSYNDGVYYKGEFSCESHEILKVDYADDDSTVKVFVQTLYDSYTFKNGYAERMGMGMEPVIITFERGTNGEYSCLAYSRLKKGDTSDDMQMLRLLSDDFEGAEDLQNECKKKAEARFDEYNASSDVKTIEQTRGTRVLSYQDSPDPINPSIRLNDDNTFSFTYSVFSSYIAIGNYEMTETKLVLKTNDEPTRVYVFDRVGDTFVFDLEKSTYMPTYKYSSGGQPELPVPDGAVFK